MAEREGFEPSVLIAEYTRVPGVHLQPLGHLSVHHILYQFSKPIAYRSCVYNRKVVFYTFYICCFMP